MKASSVACPFWLSGSMNQFRSGGVSMSLETAPFLERIKILPHDVVRVRPDNFSQPVSEPEVKIH